MKKAALTFDDGPNGQYTLKVLDILKKSRIKACFFLLGENIEYYPAIAERIKAEGHLIGSHSYSHRHMRGLRPGEVLHQIEKAEESCRKILNLRPKFFRPPYGESDKRLEKILRLKGYRLILWDACADDWKGPKPSTIASRIISQAKDGSTILLHDGANIRHNESRIKTVKALPRIIAALRERGFRIVRLDRLLSKPKTK